MTAMDNQDILIFSVKVHHTGQQSAIINGFSDFILAYFNKFTC